MSRELPDIIKEVGFDFSWDERKVWELDVPVEEMPIDELTWHFDIPFIWSKPDGYYDVNPSEVIEHPDQHPEEYERTMRADTTHPIDIMFWKKRWLILDGLHRLMKQAIEGAEIVQVRKIPESAIPLIRKS
ncbi:hypothetical protein KDA08_03325 [Candidatus Saccharibacteria bacterium]|nr:hypothetical protein [Candidatus Saccharibacteria bacterium]